MENLLKAGFTRLKKNKIFWLLLIFSIGFAFFYVGKQYSNYFQIEKNLAQIEDPKVAEQVKAEILSVSSPQMEFMLFRYPTIIGVVIAIFTSVFLGAEYFDGGIRRKISIGHSRTNIYLSNFIITSVVSLIFYFSFFLITLLEIPIIGWITIPTQEFLMSLLCIILFLVVYSAIFTFMAMICSNKNTSAIVSIILSVLLFLSALKCLELSNVSEYIGGMSFTDGETGIEEWIEEPTLNPNYEAESKRAPIYKFLVEINPAGQAQQIEAPAYEANLKIYPIYSLWEIIIFTTAGIILFNRKELN